MYKDFKFLRFVRKRECSPAKPNLTSCIKLPCQRLYSLLKSPIASCPEFDAIHLDLFEKFPLLLVDLNGLNPRASDELNESVRFLEQV